MNEWDIPPHLGGPDSLSSRKNEAFCKTDSVLGSALVQMPPHQMPPGKKQVSNAGARLWLWSGCGEEGEEKG